MNSRKNDIMDAKKIEKVTEECENIMDFYKPKIIKNDFILKYLENELAQTKIDLFWSWFMVIVCGFLIYYTYMKL